MHGIKASERQVRIYDYEGNWLEDTTLEQAIIKTKNCHSAIAEVMKGKTSSSNHFQFRELTPGKTNKKLASLVNDPRSDTTPIAKYWDNKLICVYNSISEAAKCNGTVPGSIGRSTINGTKLNGFIYKKIV